VIDVLKQIQYWKQGASEDWQVAEELIQRNRTRHGLFLAQLALEKVLKALVCYHINDIAPKIHNLVRLSEMASLSLNQSQIDILAEMNAFNIEGRYPDMLDLTPEPDEAKAYFESAQKVFAWLMKQLPE
jgi:HEPN domain-containing protein